MQAGLYLVGTPIGNLEDLSGRAIRTLGEADWIYAEDTRRTRTLLSHLGLKDKRVLAFHAHSSEKRVEGIVERIEQGQAVALVTDAGMPGVSDPGALLVRALRSEGRPVFVIPGPSAVVSAVALSGLIDGPFTFLGFLPRQGKKRERALERTVESAWPTVLFEAPQRTQKTLTDLAAHSPERRAAVCRELTKLFEETRVGTLAELAGQSDWRGEVTLVIDGKGSAPTTDPALELDAAISRRLEAGESPRQIADLLSRSTGASKRSLYQRTLELRDGADRGSERDGEPSGSE